jgi:hypothetical protein
VAANSDGGEGFELLAHLPGFRLARGRHKDISCFGRNAFSRDNRTRICRTVLSPEIKEKQPFELCLYIAAGVSHVIWEQKNITKISFVIVLSAETS